ncbi:hypothetical protein KIH39_14450 [Telmatocola sphagniphila]|uniref:Uncharacterized protein n=1 Tax=Telmatocola sphagniphila TaxID=1123043 RepID=A0A8E6B176_9BACT|nr:hypothetical protein [Telmatocola sphagniphila]QVL30060.1 hypothetical protein KIH39_14450 [Telmatocola sphagniphila]
MSEEQLDKIVQSRLMDVLQELEMQKNLAVHYPENRLSFREQMEQLREYIADTGEYGIAYESIIADLEQIPFVLSGIAAVKLLEVGLIMRYKTERPQDQTFDIRN